MAKQRLNKSIIEQFLKGATKNQRLSDAHTQGLHLKLTATGPRFYFDYKTVAGLRRTMSVGGYPALTVEQARKTAGILAGDVARGGDPQADREKQKQIQANTGREFLENVYPATLRNKKSGVETRKRIERDFSKLLDKPMANLTAADIARWQGKREGKVRYATLKRSLGSFQTMLNDAVRRGYIESNPIKGVTPDRTYESPEKLAENRARRSYLTTEQMEQVLASLGLYQEERRLQRRNSRAHGKAHLSDLDKLKYVDHVKPIISLLFYTGFRPGDAMGLRWEEVNFNFGVITKTLEKTAHKKPAPQNFPLSPPLLAVLKAWLKQQNKPTQGLVFPSPVTGKRLDKHALQKPWKKIRELAGLPKEMQLYTLRHNFASHLVMQGADLLSVAKLMGHSDVQMVVDHYGHLQPSLLKGYSDQFASLVNVLEETHGDSEVRVA